MPRYVAKEELLAMAGYATPPSAWFRVDQERIDRFAEATEDRQFIHVDPERAAATPLGSTIAHGFLTLSLLTHLSEEAALVPEGTTMVFNYGLNKVRFLQPVKAGSEVRLRSKLLSAREKEPGRILVTASSAVEIRGEDKPALLAETLYLCVLGGGTRDEA